ERRRGRCELVALARVTDAHAHVIGARRAGVGPAVAAADGLEENAAVTRLGPHRDTAARRVAGVAPAIFAVAPIPPGVAGDARSGRRRDADVSARLGIAARVDRAAEVPGRALRVRAARNVLARTNRARARAALHARVAAADAV